NSQIEAAQAAVAKAEANLQSAQAAYDRVAWHSDIASRPEAVTLQSATIDYQQAKANLSSLMATAGTDADSKVKQAKSQLDQAQANLVKLQNQVTQDDLTSAQAQVIQASNNLEKLLAGPDANALDIAQSGVDQAEIAVKQADLKLRQSQIVAPFDGTVTAVNVTEGQTAGGSGGAAAIQLDDLDHLEIVVDMAEVDLSQIKVGQDAEITLDALPDTTLQGKVTDIAPAGVQNQGVVNYPVTISLTNPPAAVKTGMTANVNIVVQQRDNILMVPNRAIHTQGRQRFVTVLFEGRQIQVPVQTGLSNDTNTEIVSGLKEGDEVIISGTSTTQPNVRFGGGPGLGGGPGFGGPR
ncbi:MAG TPA: hypothetical protein DEP84_35605, partial [Chloroflexi bacterium]|nr:hypothetical protein [Chloroflexota bacterium]